MTLQAYVNDRFLADPGAAFGREWLDDQGRAIAGPAGAVEVRFRKVTDKKAVLVGRFTVAEARDRGLIREGC